MSDCILEIPCTMGCILKIQVFKVNNLTSKLCVHNPEKHYLLPK